MLNSGGNSAPVTMGPLRSGHGNDDGGGDELLIVPPPYKVKVVEPITLLAPEERKTAMANAGFNTFLLRSDEVFIDLLTDSGTSAISQEQKAMMELGDEAYAGSRSYFRLEDAMHEVYGYKHLIPTHQGRGAEHLLARILVKPGLRVPSNLYFTTSREHVVLAGGIWEDIAVPEARQPESMFPFKGNVDLEHLESLLSEHGHDGIAYVRVEACVNMAGGQPFALQNLRRVRELTHKYNVPLILDATRMAENALFVKEREAGQGDRPMREILKEMASLSDGAVFSSKKDHFVPIGGMLCLNDDKLAEHAREDLVLFEGFVSYGGLAGHDMEALAQGIREAADEKMVGAYVAQARALGRMLEDAGIPIVQPVGAHAIFLDAKRFFPHIPQEQFPAQALAASIYLAGGVRSMERGIVSGQHGKEPYHGLELVRLTLPRRVYTYEHLLWVAQAVKAVWRRRELVPGLRMTYEPEHLRFFLARFEPLADFPDFAAAKQAGAQQKKACAA